MTERRKDGSETAESQLRWDLRTLLLVPFPVAVFLVAIYRPIGRLHELRYSEGHLALAFGLGAVIGIGVAIPLILRRRPILGVTLGILVCSIVAIIYVSIGTGIPLDWYVVAE